MRAPGYGDLRRTAEGLIADRGYNLRVQMPRSKPRLFWIRAAYLAKRVALKVLPQRLLLRVMLNTAWLSHRFAHELVSSEYGSAFHNSQLGISEGLLRSVIQPSDTVLDVGCGYGRISRLCAAFAKEVVGIDYDPKNLSQCQKDAPPNCTFILGDVTRDLNGRMFDVAILSHVLEHIDDSRAFLRTVRATRLLVEVPDFNSNPLNSVRERLELPAYSDADHIREYTKDTLRADIESGDWKLESIESRDGMLVAVAAKR